MFEGAGAARRIRRWRLRVPADRWQAYIGYVLPACPANGRFAGYNVVCDLLGEPMLPLHIDYYVTVLDLGSWGAVYTEGWNRHVVLRQGSEASKANNQLPANLPAALG
jgi:hypothetical protein